MKLQAPAIVLIEKDDLTLEIYQRELSNSFLVFCFTELNGIPEILNQQDIQVIVIEPEICAGQGWQWISNIQKTFSGRDIPIIVCSTRDASRKSSGPPIALYLTKPVLPKTLCEKILGVLASKKRERSI
jgi:DNA-binding response OmpR family regulator